jgi:uncharacterized RDD family membrane protein YckC
MVLRATEAAHETDERMHCQYCGLINGEDDHRCLRCGRRMTGVAIAAPTSYIGATALAVARPEMDSEISPPRAQGPQQPPLFQAAQALHAPSQKVIPFPAPAGNVSTHRPAPLAPQSPALPPSRSSAKRPAAPAGQGNLDFRPNVPQGERILATGVPAQVYGDGRVAPPMRRMTAGAMDVSMVLLGFGVFAGAARFAASYLTSAAPDAISGSAFGAGKAVWITLAVSLILISLFYGLIWAIARRETAGMNWTQLHLVTFDGSPLDGRNRAIRFISAWLSYCSGGLGLLWALADEENLAFHDHISKTYPAESGSARVLFKERR